MNDGGRGGCRVSRIIQDSGLWDDGRHDTHGFRVTDTLVDYTPEQAAQLRVLGGAIHDVMEGMSRIIGIASNPVLATGSTWSMVRKVTGMMVPGFMRPLQALSVHIVPSLIKVDVMEDVDGLMRVAEIDATNRRGMGYTSLFERARAEIDPHCTPLGKSIIPALAEYVKMLCEKLKKPAQLGYVYAHQERFYKPEFVILKRELAGHGVELVLGDEYETRVDGDIVVIDGVRCESGLMADFALKLVRTDLMAQFADLYTRGQVRLLIPARPFLGSKGLLALIHNADDDKRLEAILLSQIDPDALALMRKHVPVTRFVTSKSERPERGVLKEVISSGMKGVYFADEDDFDAAWRDARGRPYQYVLQDHVDCRLREFFVRDLDRDEYVREQLRTRLIVYYVKRVLCGGVVTAGDGVRIHGGGRSVFTSSIVR